MFLTANRLQKLALAPLLLLGFIGNSAWAEPAQRWGVNMTPGVTDVSRQIFDLHMLIFWICVAIGIAVFGVLFWSLIFHRKSLDFKPSTFHESTKVELAWTIVPFFILVAMAIPSTKALVHIYDFSDADMDVVITAYQWKWKYEYIQEDGENVSFFSNLATTQDAIYGREDKGENYLLEVDQMVYLPVDKKTRFLVTAADVIHSWWVPALAVKKDAIPGFINEAYAIPKEEGIYRGQCAELCGKDHGFMPIVVNVVSQDKFDSWLGDKKAAQREFKATIGKTFTMDELMAKGGEIYGRSCVACHGANGEGGVGPAIAGSKVATGTINTHMNTVVNGVSGTMMQAFGAQLNEVELAAVITYQRNSFGNNMGDMVQPLDIDQFKKGQ